MPALAYFLTWTTYGTWVHGDERGSVDDAHNRVGEARLVEDSTRRAGWFGALRERPFLLDERARVIVEDSIRDHADRRRWRIDALAVCSNHVHVVVAAPSHRPAIVAGQFKAWGTRRLRAAGLIGDRERVWTKMGSTRSIHTEASRVAAVDYVVNFQDAGRGRFSE
jgi:REP element-mobilizing transposase RayT